MLDKQEHYHCSIHEKDKMCEILSKYGIAFCYDLIPQMLLSELQSEHEVLIQEEHHNVLKKFSGNIVQRWLVKDLEEKFPVIQSVTEINALKAIADDFYGEFDYSFLSTYATYDVGPDMINNFWHQDPSGGLKCLIYLDDVSLENGAFYYEPGSHKYGYYLLKHVRAGETPKQGLYFSSEDIVNPVPFVGRAGTAILFNTNGRHKAGDIQKEQVRRTVNYHILGTTWCEENFDEKHRKFIIHPEPVA